MSKHGGRWCRDCHRDGKGKNPHLKMHSPGGEDETAPVPFRPGKTRRKRRLSGAESGRRAA